MGSQQDKVPGGGGNEQDSIVHPKTYKFHTPDWWMSYNVDKTGERILSKANMKKQTLFGRQNSIVHMLGWLIPGQNGRVVVNGNCHRNTKNMPFLSAYKVDPSKYDNATQFLYGNYIERQEALAAQVTCQKQVTQLCSFEVPFWKSGRSSRLKHFLQVSHVCIVSHLQCNTTNALLVKYSK